MIAPEPGVREPKAGIAEAWPKAELLWPKPAKLKALELAAPKGEAAGVLAAAPYSG